MIFGLSFWITVLLLLAFGFIYNLVVAWLEKTGRHEGYVAYLVVGGCLVIILASIPEIGLINGVKVLGFFAAGGFFMVLGSSARSADARVQDATSANQLARELLNDKEKGGKSGI